MRFTESDEFKREFKKLSKKYSGLDVDFTILKGAIKAKPAGNGTKHWNRLKSDEGAEKYIMKMRMMCRSTKGANFRVIYFYNGEGVEVLFIEIYFKGKKENEDKNRIEEIWDEYSM